MKTFTKGNLTTVVDDNDFRIASYIANGWKESVTTDKPKDEVDERIATAIDAVNASEADSKKGKGSKKRKIPVTEKKVDESIVATETAAIESEVVDDGLITPSELDETEDENND